MAPIKIPKTPRRAYNPARPPNALLLAQVRELEKAVRDEGRKVSRVKPKTEADAAAYIRHLNRALHHQVLLPELKRQGVRAPAPVALARKRGKKR